MVLSNLVAFFVLVALFSWSAIATEMVNDEHQQKNNDTLMSYTPHGPFVMCSYL